MRGTEKQIAWANEILKNINAVIDYTIEKAVPTFNLPEEAKKAGIANLENLKAKVNSEDYAGTLIDVFGGLKATGDMGKDFAAMMAAANLSGYKF